MTAAFGKRCGTVEGRRVLAVEDGGCGISRVGVLDLDQRGFEVLALLWCFDAAACGSLLTIAAMTRALASATSGFAIVV